MAAPYVQHRTLGVNTSQCAAQGEQRSQHTCRERRQANSQNCSSLYVHVFHRERRQAIPMASNLLRLQQSNSMHRHEVQPHAPLSRVMMRKASSPPAVEATEMALSWRCPLRLDAAVETSEPTTEGALGYKKWTRGPSARANGGRPSRRP